MNNDLDLQIDQGDLLSVIHDLLFHVVNYVSIAYLVVSFLLCMLTLQVLHHYWVANMVPLMALVYSPQYPQPASSPTLVMVIICLDRYHIGLQH